jgi:hypothetical protein
MGGTDRPREQLAESEAAKKCCGFCPYGSLRREETEIRFGYPALAKELKLTAVILRAEALPNRISVFCADK